MQVFFKITIFFTLPLAKINFELKFFKETVNINKKKQEVCSGHYHITGHEHQYYFYLSILLKTVCHMLTIPITAGYWSTKEIIP